MAIITGKMSDSEMILSQPEKIKWRWMQIWYGINVIVKFLKYNFKPIVNALEPALEVATTLLHCSPRKSSWFFWV